MAPEDGGQDTGAWRRAYRSTLAPPSGCPEDEVLAALVLDELQGEERLRVADHLTGCARCPERYRLLAELHQEARPAAHRPWRRGLWLTAAAAAAVIAAGAVVRLGWPDRPADELRGPEAARSIAPAPDAVLTAPPAELAWAAEPGAEGYRVRLFDARAERLWEGERTASTSQLLPAEVQRRLTPGAAYFWVVEVEGPADRRRLGPFWFQLKGGG
jgi:hypothetical protein